jgi:ATP-dependent Clp protease ATP-binding subunit ClpA
MFNDEKALIRVDMSEFMEKHAVSKLIGAPPGYVGYDEGGNLTEMIRHRPYAVVLFDEIEKAHPEVFNILLQILDNGKITDSKGRSVNFRNSVIIMTSNIGAQFIDKMQKLGFSSGEISEDYIATKEKVLASLKDYFRPEFLNRLDDIIVFDVLKPEAIAKIVELQVDIVKTRLKEKGISLSVAGEVYEYLAKEGYNPQYGARPLKRLIQNKILTQVANLIIARGLGDGGEVAVTLKGKDFVFDVKNAGKKMINKSIKSAIKTNSKETNTVS